ncbi:MAG: hypothetical protein KAT38_08530, partial [Bacteroidales bacterium]|nr:hypothetical protein [Bacteroidales bacterium]
LEEKAENAKTDVKAKYKEKTDELRAKKESIQKKARNFRVANEETLGSVKESIENSLTNLTNAINNTFKKFSEEDPEEKN